ncbi:MAG: IS1182 family transposase [Actinobacteria bacterium]|nr:IS1182 family transposase [Actinomycetota bacterium]
MSMHPQPIGPVPQDTARVARAAFPKGNVYMQIRDVLGTIYEDEDFSELFEVRGRPAITPWRLALVTVMQFSEGLSDRQAAEAVRARIDWKYALGLQLTDPGFNFSVLSEFRSRLVEGGKERLLLEELLEGCKERGYLKVRGRQRTDSTHVLGALRVLSKWERTAETMRSALNALASAEPEWLTEHADPEWFERYGRRIEDQRLPKGKEAREEYLKTVGADGIRLLAHIDDPQAPQGLKELADVEILRQIWEQHYQRIDGEIRVLDPKEMPEAAHRIESPYEVEARYSTKRSMDWVGYKVHLTESCDEGFPHLITDVHTTAATATDVKQLSAIQDGLARSGLLPAFQLADASYVCGSNLVSSHARHKIDLIGPPYKDNTWQAKADQGFDVAKFSIDWEKKMATCPQERKSIRWSKTKTARGRKMIHVEFASDDCDACPSRPLCTRAKNLPRALTLQPREEHEAIQFARRRQKTEEFASLYSQRAGIEGTVSQGVRAFGLRQARYQGLERTHLQEVATAAAINVSRLADWLNGVPAAATRRSRLAVLAQAS